MQILIFESEIIPILVQDKNLAKYNLPKLTIIDKIRNNIKITDKDYLNNKISEYLINYELQTKFICGLNLLNKRVSKDLLLSNILQYYI